MKNTQEISDERPPVKRKDGILCSLSNTQAVQTVRALHLAHIVQVPVKITVTQKRLLEISLTI